MIVSAHKKGEGLNNYSRNVSATKFFIKLNGRAKTSDRSGISCKNSIQIKIVEEEMKIVISSPRRHHSND